MLPDLQQRQAALDPNQSFIVQAPAGSGKTELLTRRFLTLLSRVKQPEEIIALTFTRRAAGEMRQRIVQALQLAREDEPSLAHKKETWQLAVAAMKKSKQEGWNLTQNPNRLRISTIDALAASLCRQLPTHTPDIAASNISYDPNSLYKRAAINLLTETQTNPDMSSQLAILQGYYDNNPDRLINLFCAMLPKREQWLAYVCTHKGSELRDLLQNNLKQLAREKLKNLQSLFNGETGDKLYELVYYAANNIIKNDSNHPLNAIVDIKKLADTYDIKHLSLWQAISKLCLTDKLELRRSVNKKIGFPAATDCKDKHEKNHRNALKQKMIQFLEMLQNRDDIIQALQQIYQCPPIIYDKKQWQVLDSLCTLLPRCIAHLQLVFQQAQATDFVEINLAAQRALGQSENPTELALQLDYKIQHLLIDEFQDTAYLHYHLIEQLLAGWQANDGRSLFIVGDPMQSIYRFRQAEVGLFIQTKRVGIADIPLKPLTLCSNFRSTGEHVHWVNQTCSTLFPMIENAEQGAIRYSPAIAAQNIESSPTIEKNDKKTIPGPIYIHAFAPDQLKANDNESLQIIHHIEDIQKKSPTDSIAILVRSRNHLISICQRLREHKVPFHAIDIEALSHVPLCSDLHALTRALNHPADDIAWYSVLRAPWCGLDLQTLLEISDIFKASKRQHLSEMLFQTDFVEQISHADDRQSLMRVLCTLKNSLETKGYNTNARWLYRTWVDLGGIATVDTSDKLIYAEAYFELVDQIEQHTGAFNLELLETRLEKAYVNMPALCEKDNLTLPVTIMTIHKSKGLEFDHVFIPQMQRKLIAPDNPMLRWMTWPKADNETCFILAPLTGAAEQKPEPIYQYLRELDKEKNQLESIRLFYVAITRAKKQLYLSCSHKVCPKKIEAGGIKNALSIPAQSQAGLLIEDMTRTAYACWQECGENDYQPLADKNEIKVWQQWKVEPNQNHLASAHSYLHTNASPQNVSKPNPAPERNTLQQQAGTLMHELLAKMSLSDSDQWPNIIEQSEQWLYTQLISASSDRKKLQATIELIKRSLKNMIASKRGQWILKQSYANSAHSEKQITIFDREIPRKLIIDRTFITRQEDSSQLDGKSIRWIIDYKCSVMTHAKQNAQDPQAPNLEPEAIDQPPLNPTLTTSFPELKIQGPKHQTKPLPAKEFQAFIIDQLQQHKKQLTQYAYYYQQIDPEHPIMLGIYFPIYDAWAQWLYIPKNLTDAAEPAELADCVNCSEININ